MTTQQILTFDNSRIKTYKHCPREYQLAHMLNWQPLGDAPPLVFGGAYHEAMAAIFRNKDTAPRDSLIDLAMNAFFEEWEKRDGPSSMEKLEEWYPRTPTTAETSLHNWLEKNYSWLMQIKVLEIEEPFAVPLFVKHQCPYCMKQLSPSYWENNTHCLHCHEPLTEVFLIGRRDLVYEFQKKIYVMDTKTTTLYKAPAKGSPASKGGFQFQFTEQFHIDSQVDGYYFTTILTHGSCEAMNINAIQIKKNHHDVLEMFEYYRDFRSLYAWFSETCVYVNRILKDTAAGPQQFTRNPEACGTKYGFCKYYTGVCRIIFEPAAEIAQPVGFKIDKWEPFDEEELKALIMKTREDPKCAVPSAAIPQ